MRIYMSGYDNRAVFMDMPHIETNFRITKQGINRIHCVPPFGLHMIGIIRYTLRISGWCSNTEELLHQCGELNPKIPGLGLILEGSQLKLWPLVAYWWEEMGIVIQHAWNEQGWRKLFNVNCLYISWARRRSSKNIQIFDKSIGNEHMPWFTSQ